MADMYFSSFMFTANLQPDSGEYTKTPVKQMRALLDMGCVGFDPPIAAGTTAFATGVESCQDLRRAFGEAGLRDVEVTTNAGATCAFDPPSMSNASNTSTSRMSGMDRAANPTP